MTVSDILNEIHNENVEVEIYKALSEWMILERQRNIVELARYKSTIKQINDIVYPLRFCCTDELEHKAIVKIRDICSIYQKGGKR